MKKYLIYTDGGSRGNPGPSGLGVVFCDGKGKTIKSYSEALGKKTNNEAEYLAVIFALKKFKALFGKKEAKEASIEIRSDSQLLVRQMNGEYKIEDEKIQKLFLQVWNLKIDFEKVSFVSVPREENVQADRLANEAMDSQARNKRLI